MIERLERAGFRRLGEDRSARPDLKQQITTWILVDGEGTTAAEVGVVPGGVVCGFITLFGDGALLMTGHGFGERHRAQGFALQVVPSSVEDAWRQHHEARDEMADRHGAALRLRSMGDLLAHSAPIRARLMDHRPGCVLWMMRGWIAGAVIVWAALAITGVPRLRSGITEAALSGWLSGLRAPMIIGLLAAGLPTLLHLLLSRMQRLAAAARPGPT